uniref:Uncharacterized protein n=1 Tax=Arundo donax TaxID=35708 RepID=A0A0A9BIB2_ARUDO
MSLPWNPQMKGVAWRSPFCALSSDHQP